MKFRAILILFFLAVLKANAASDNDTIIIKSDNSSDRIASDLDSLVNTWYVKIAVKNNTETKGDTVGFSCPDSVYSNRINKINSIIKLNYNSIIKNHIEVYTIRKREKFAAVLGLKDYYFPMIEDVFDSYGLPAELKYMAVIESALNPGVVNGRSGATGLWQFMYSRSEERRVGKE